MGLVWLYDSRNQVWKVIVVGSSTPKQVISLDLLDNICMEEVWKRYFCLPGFLFKEFTGWFLVVVDRVSSLVKKTQTETVTLASIVTQQNKWRRKTKPLEINKGPPHKRQIKEIKCLQKQLEIKPRQLRACRSNVSITMFAHTMQAVFCSRSHTLLGLIPHKKEDPQHLLIICTISVCLPVHFKDNLVDVYVIVLYCQKINVPITCHSYLLIFNTHCVSSVLTTEGLQDTCC